MGSVLECCGAQLRIRRSFSFKQLPEKTWINCTFDFYNAFARTAADSVRQLTELNSRAYERLIKRQIELADRLH
jgi:hypothetical protein